MKVYTMLQATAEWWTVRLGVPTSSNFSRIITPAQGKPSAQQDGYINELIDELINPQQIPFFSDYENMRPMTKAMAHGVDYESTARCAYAFLADAHVKQVGFIESDDGRAGCSPDGLVGEDGSLELKCPLTKTQVGYLRSAQLPDEYKCQVHGHLVITGRKWVDFFSYAPPLEPFHFRVEPDEFTEKLATVLTDFCDKYESEIRRVLGISYHEAIERVRQGEVLA